MALEELQPGPDCPNGGVTVHSGIDDNGNGNLDANEIDQSINICHGDPGAVGDDGTNGEDGEDGAAGSSVLIATASVLAGPNCAEGGVMVTTGLDDNGDGELGSDEVDQTAYVCHGTDGAAGAAGAAGAGCSSTSPVAWPFALGLFALVLGRRRFRRP